MDTKRLLVTDIMVELGIPAHRLGYNYLREAIIMVYENFDEVFSITKLLYPKIAKQFKTSNEKVERAIRNTIEISWKRGSAQTIDEIFGKGAHERWRPTNSEYIAGVVDYLKINKQ